MQEVLNTTKLVIKLAEFNASAKALASLLEDGTIQDSFYAIDQISGSLNDLDAPIEVKELIAKAGEAIVLAKIKIEDAVEALNTNAISAMLK